jgi:hypothetical protein
MRAAVGGREEAGVQVLGFEGREGHVLTEVACV